MTRFFVLLFLICTLPALAATPAPAAKPAAVPARPFELFYTVDPLPDKDQMRVTIALGKGGELVKQLTFAADPKRFSVFRATGEFSNVAGTAIWRPNGNGAKLVYLVKVSHARSNGSFDARMTADWAIFRGDKIFPRIKARMKKGATSKAQLSFRLPKDWTHLDTGWPRIPGGPFLVDSSTRRFDRPIGWMIAGKIGTRRDSLGMTEVAVAAPRGDPLDRMDALTMINFVWPEFETAFGKTPPKILIIGGGDPMWRGGLSAPNSLFLHSERPLISENATSTLVHELVHVVTRIRGEDRSDWIAEGLAEFYSIELVYRAGGMSDARHEKVFDWLRDWSRNVNTLRGDSSSAETTARAVLLLRDLDKEIRSRTKDRKSIDDLARALRIVHAVSTAELIAVSEKVMGGKSKVLATPLLR